MPFGVLFLRDISIFIPSHKPSMCFPLLPVSSRRITACPALNPALRLSCGCKHRRTSTRQNRRCAGAVNYFLNEWDGIEAIATGGDYAWDNNLIERINRYISLSGKNSQFFGSHAGAGRGAIFYSMAGSCRLNRINFFEYLSDMLNRVAAMPNGAPPDAFRDGCDGRYSESCLISIISRWFSKMLLHSLLLTKEV